MNEFKIITYLLARKGGDTGADAATLKRALGIEQDDDGTLHGIMDAYARHVAVLGLAVERNPLNGHWFLASDGEISAKTIVNPFPGNTRLASTLLAIVLATARDGEAPSTASVRDIRKVKDIKQDLKELQAMNLIKVDGDVVHLTDEVGYVLDLPALLAMITDTTRPGGGGCESQGGHLP